LHSPTKYTYVWQRCDSGGASCSTLATVSKTAATSVTYKLVAADDKHTIRLSVTAINSLGSSSPFVSGATSVVDGEPVYSSGFSLTGTATVGQTLTAHAGTWTHSPTKYTYTWKRCDSSGNNCNTTITSSTTSTATATYKLVSTDDHHTVVVSVYAQNSAGAGTPQTSAATGVVNGEPIYVSGVAVGGALTVGQKLTATAGSWSPAATKYTYQWERCDSGGGSCTIVSTTSGTSAASNQYKLVSADHGHTIRVIVTATNAAGASIPHTTSATAPVARRN
jgi:hypothetical protein